MLNSTFLKHLQSIVGASNLLTADGDKWPYSYDNSRYQAMPDAVAFANETQQIQPIVRLCNQYNVFLIARGKGTGTTGATVPDRGGLILSLERLNRIIEIDPANRLARVEPGVTNAALQQAVAEHGFFWPPDPTSSAICTIGGNLAYNSAGPRAVKYGTPRENTLGLSAITGAGEAIQTGVRTTKGVVGYDLTRLLIGSEGNLAIITEATLKLTPLAEEKRTLQAIYSSIQAASKAVSSIMAQPVTPCALEFMDGKAIAMVSQFSNLNLPTQAQALLMIEVDGSTACLDAAVTALIQAASNEGLINIEQAKTQQQVDKLWKTRKALSPALRNVAPKKINEDVVVPVSYLPDLISGLEKLAEQFNILIVNFGHAGNGNIHVNLLVNPDDQDENQRAEACLNKIFDLVLSLNGSLSGEHGVGLEKRDHIHREIDPPTLQLMRNIRKQFDPKQILNPGKSLPEN